MVKRLLAVALGVVATVAFVANRRRSVRAARNVEVAKLGSRVGAGWAAHRARRVFASAERREILDASFELRSAEQVVAALGNMKGALMKLGQMMSYVDESVPAPVPRGTGAAPARRPADERSTGRAGH